MNSPEQHKSAPVRPSLKKVALGSPAGFLAFGFGSGLSPFAPGTMGTLVAIPFIFVLKEMGNPGFWVVLVLLFLLGVKLCGDVSRKLGVHDHGGIVWDEMVGYWLSAAFVPLQWPWLLAAFLLFRFFDIVKPWPIRQLDKEVSGGFGIMIDDVVAALFTVAILAVLQSFWGV
ncbi:MAG: phosphatidylglycerophosphatase A [Xanthomonadales bacterium]|nr:phosphatidylglycerophosphatase A [Xanthomonadales bacterium]